MRKSFVFYESFREIFELLEDPEDWQNLLSGMFAYVFDGKEIFFPDTALQIAFTHFKVAVDSASQKYEKSKQDGERGGRPNKRDFISPDVWITAILEQGSIPKAAKVLGLSKQTLYTWVANSDDPRLEAVQSSVQSSKNLNVNVNDNANVNAALLFTNKKEPRQPAAGPSGPPSASAKKELRPPPLPIPERRNKGDERKPDSGRAGRDRRDAD